jgi:hypothetical protein
MRLSVVTITDRGVPNRERLRLTALTDANLVNYVIFDTIKMANGTAVDPVPRHVLWFTPYLVKAGDDIIVYSRAGTPSASAKSGGGRNHFFFWGLGKTIWGHKDACAVVLEINDWATSP